MCARVSQDGTTPLYDACSRGDTAIVKVLLSVADVNPNMVRSVSGRWCCVRYGCVVRGACGWLKRGGCERVGK